VLRALWHWLRVRIEIERRVLVLPGPGLFDQAVAPHDSDQVELEFVTPHSGTGVIIQLRAVADSLLIAAPCRARSIFQIRLNEHSSTSVECLAPLNRHLEGWVMLCNMLYNRGGVISHIPVI
jgi:hypothetical protein